MPVVLPPERSAVNPTLPKFDSTSSKLTFDFRPEVIDS
jgi:hypothetical protein